MISASELKVKHPLPTLQTKVNNALSSIDTQVNNRAIFFQTNLRVELTDLYPEVIDPVISALQDLGYTVTTEEDNLVIDWSDA